MQSRSPLQDGAFRACAISACPTRKQPDRRLNFALLGEASVAELRGGLAAWKAISGATVAPK
ncbi:MAG: hypothetical protein MUC60_05850 [Oscillatoria sp. Prado101]|nr:hypothetical protein [Oscillatoria sp. Prado101]